MKNILSLSLLSLAMSSLAQESTFQTIKTDHGSFQLKAINHASMVLIMDGKTIYVDPHGPAEWYKGIEKADFIIITDVHPDHYSSETIEAVVSEESKFIAPQAVANMMPEKWKDRCEVMKNNQVLNLDAWQLQAIPMYNLPESPESPHVKGRGNGYLIELDDFRIYISGDTGPSPEMKALRNIDMAFVCMNLPYTMSVEDAAEAVKVFKPKVVYPYHYRNADKSFSDIQKFCELVGSAGVECTPLNWYPGVD